ncbi:MAG TPA: anthranilate phosphoribosyltransferase [Thermoanaerobaculia bacterium]|nr:anthranilate phosphoribosyltransferase [Thermoanaerobaculia bacterium]
MIESTIRKIVDGQHLSRTEMHSVLSDVMDGGASDVQKSALLVALRMKGETVDEVTGAAEAMRERVVPLNVNGSKVVDTCGTGGDGRGTINISTIAALVAAGAGVPIAKHGNRAVSSSCGSADVLAELGARIDLDAPAMERVFEQAGISFLFAPKLHPAMAAVVGVRKELGLRTIFNVLGPLTNPARAQRQVLGVYAMRLVPLIGEVLRALGAERALVVHSRDGMDEISPAAPTEVCEVRGDGELERYTLQPEEMGLERTEAEALGGGDAAANARAALRVLEGGRGAHREAVVANAGAAIYVGGQAGTIREGVELARESIDSGRARAKLSAMIEATHAAGAAS